MPQPKPKPKIKNHGKIIMTQTGTLKYSRKAEENRGEIMLFISVSNILLNVAKLKRHERLEIAYSIIRMLHELKGGQS